VNASALEWLGMLVACGAAATALVAGDRRVRLAAMTVALAIAPIIVLGDVWDEPRVIDFRHSAAQIGLAAVVVVGGLALLTALFRRYPPALPIVAVAVLPLRVPFEIGGQTANLLVPLYLVIAAGVLTHAVGSGQMADGRARADGPWPRRLRWVLAATLVLYAVQASYSEDVPNAIENIGFFLVPFAILFVLLAELDWSPRLLRTTLIAVALVASACALIAVYQYFARDLFLNPELFDANQLHVYFRTNSIFFDPNVFGRYMALALTAVAACLAWGGDRRDLMLGSLVFALGLVGLAFSYSLTSFAALITGLAVVAILRFRWRGAAIVGGMGAVALVALVIAGGTPTSDIQSDRSIDSGHSDLVEGGIELAEDRPIAGWGSGAFGRAFYEQIEQARTTVSHSEPITVAAEQGAIGLVVYVALLVCALVMVLGAGAGGSLARAAIAACFCAILLDSFGYTGFVIDPAVWALLALGVALRRGAVEAPDSDPPEASATVPA
jgi:putative inorganic carbon (hco3(-)) transporter